jgi:hypothetical protein
MKNGPSPLSLPYTTSKPDFRFLQRGIKLAFSAEIKSFFFKPGLADTDIVLFDSTYLYIFSTGNYNLPVYREFVSPTHRVFYIKHHLAISRKNLGRCFSLWFNKSIRNLLWNASEKKRWQPIFCAPMSTFCILNKKDRKEYSLYSYTEGYTFTVVHEFAHVYYDLHARSSDYNLRGSMELLSSALQLRKGHLSGKLLSSLLPKNRYLGDLFALLLEYEAASRLSSIHRMRMDLDINATLSELATEEKTYIKASQPTARFAYSSALSYPHNFAKVLLPIALKLHPHDWHEWLLSF